MNLINKLKPILPYCLIALISYGFYLIALNFLQFIAKINSDTAVAIIAASASLLISVITVLITKHYERKQEILKELSLKKIPIYQNLIGFFFRIILGEKSGQMPPSEKEIIEFMSKMTEELISWSSDEVLIAFSSFRTNLIQLNDETNKGDPLAIMYEYEQLLQIIRKDLGHANQNFKRGTILKLFLNDIKN